MTAISRSGGCACGDVHFVARGDALRAGICHCLTCQRALGSAFNAFAIFPRDHVSVEGDVLSWDSSPTYQRLFCASCGSPVAGLIDAEIELPLCSFGEPLPVSPQYESWIIRRLPWVRPLDVTQFARGRIP